MTARCRHLALFDSPQNRRKTGLEPIEKTIIDRCVRLVYREYLTCPSPDKMPTLHDLYDLLRSQIEPEAQRIATALEIYVIGSLNVFSHRTNVDKQNRLVCFDIKELGKGLKKIAMLILHRNHHERKCHYVKRDL